MTKTAYDQAFAPATDQQCADIRAELKKAQARAAACADECQELAVKLKALQAQEPTMEMVEAGRQYVLDNERSSEVAFYPAMNTIRNLYVVMRRFV